MSNVFTQAKTLLASSHIRKVKFEIELTEDGQLNVLYQAQCPVDEKDAPEVVKIKSELTRPLMMKATASELDQQFPQLLEQCMAPVAETAGNLEDISRSFKDAAEAAKKATEAAKAQAAKDKAAAARSKKGGKGAKEPASASKQAVPSAAQVAAATAEAADAQPTEVEKEQQGGLFDLEPISQEQ